ncbi:MAG: hypothetical protein IJ498_09005 [Akkermansia sp.]|nr:hypothetical protein [Akkermansia sp.]
MKRGFLQYLPFTILLGGIAAAAPVQVGILPAKIVPEQVATLPLERGIVSDLATPGEPRKRGDVLAVLNKEQMEQEREEMELKLARDRMSRKDEIRKLEAQRRKIVFYLRLSNNERRYAQTAGGENDLPPTDESLADIDERIALLKREVESMGRIRNNELTRKHARNTLRMPFDGRVQYHFTLPEDTAEPFEYNATGSLPFATICDDSAFYITVNIGRAELTQLPEQQFQVLISLPEGRELRGDFSHRRVEQGNGGDMLVYFFRIPEKDHDCAFSMLGSHARAQLIFNAPEGTMQLDKGELARHPMATECRNWEELIQKLYPEYHLVLIGEHQILIRPR